MEQQIRKRLEQAITERVFPGAVVGVVDRRGKRVIVPIGNFTYDSSSPFVEENTIYDVASITKSIPVSTLALQLIQEGKLALTDKAVTYVPELKHTRFCSDVSIHHYLTMTLDYHVPLSSLKEKPPVEILEAIFATQFRYQPGERMNYSNASSIILGIILERVMGKTLAVLAEERFFRPLGMSETTFYPKRLPKKRIVPTEDDPWRRRVIQGDVHDESAFVLRQKIIPGSAGLFSTAPDLLQFLEMLLMGGTYQGKQFFSAEMIRQMVTNQLVAIGAVGGLGWELNQTRYMGTASSQQTIGKTGFTGCVVMCDIKKGKGLVILSNYHFPRRKFNTKKLNEMRCSIADIVFN